MKPPLILLLSLMAILFQVVSTQGEESQGALSLQEAIEIALEHNFSILSAKEAIQGAEHRRKSALTDFFPKLSARGNYTWLDEVPSREFAGTTVETGEDETWAVQGSITQPIFTGGALINQYRRARIAVDSTETALERTKQDLSLQVVQDYLNVLNAIAQKGVADKAVELLESQREVSQEFYNVGMIPKNDLLQTEVQLAERIREQTRAENAVELAKARFNVTLQRPVQTLVDLVVPERKYAPFPIELEGAIRTALENRLEIREQALRVAASERNVRIEQSRYYPKIQLSYNRSRTYGYTTEGEEEEWDVKADATWTFWEWGKKVHDVSAARSQVLRDRYDLMQLKDQIALEVKEAYLELKVSERNIFVAEKAVEQGEENFRMNQERYKEQVGTITEVLDAETLLRQAEADYYNALRNYNVAKAALRRAMGLKVFDPADFAPE